jgi:hypothetical protein
MKVNPVNVLIAAAFLFPIIRGFIRRYSSKNLKEDLNDVESDTSFIAALALGLFFCRKIFFQQEEGIYRLIYESLPEEFLNFIESKPSLIYIIVLPVFVIAIYSLLKLLLGIINYLLFHPFLDYIEDSLNRSSSFNKSVMGAFFELPKGICYVIFLTFLLNFISILNLNKEVNRYLAGSDVYNYICREVVIPVSNSKIARQLPGIINNSFRIEVKQASGETVDSRAARGRTIIYYNGVTLEDGIKSNSSIDKFARELVADETTDMLKAKKLYTWIGSNISYDYDKANKVLNSDFNIKSGAVPAFEENSGICFDYSCLYVAMCRAVGLKVRLVTGEGFNGASWVSHAWNQVYISEEDKWVNVDTTFYKGGNYFNSRRFDLDHRDATVAGEW